MEREYEHGGEAEAGDPRTVIISLSGRQHRTRLASLRLYPDSRLGRISLAASLEEVRALCDGFVPGRVPVLYFDRNPQHFGECLQYTAVFLVYSALVSKILVYINGSYIKMW